MTDKEIMQLWNKCLVPGIDQSIKSFARALLAASAPNPSDKQAHAIECEYIQNDSPLVECTCGFTNPSDKQEAAKYLVIAMDDDQRGHPTFCADENALRSAVRDCMFMEGVELDRDENEQVAGTVQALIEEGRVSFEGDPGIHLYHLPEGYAAPIAQSAEQDRIDAELFQRLLHARSELGRTIANPLWADHSEVTKAALKRWHRTIDEVIKGASK